MNVLHIDSAITGEASVSRKLSAAIVAGLTRAAPAAEVVYRDLGAQPLPYFSAETMAGVTVVPQPQPPADQALVQLDSQVLREFMEADTIVVGVPMYNFGVPAQLKSWIDYLSVKGVTFQYTAEGPVGLAGGKRVILASARGGLYGPGAPAASLDHQEPYLLAVLGFFGIDDVTVVRAEGLAMGPEAATASVAAAMLQIEGLEHRPTLAAAA